MDGVEHARFLSGSPEDTERFGEALARLASPGTVFALRGELASGKTCLVRGMARHLAAGQATHSPTFTLVNEYGAGPDLYHLDLYRLSGPEELADLGYEELFGGSAMCAVEWADRAEILLPPQRVDVTLGHVAGDQRRIECVNRGVLRTGWAEALARIVPA